MASKTITFRLPAEVIEVIESQARATGRNRTAIVIEALAQTYGLQPPSPAPVTTEILQQQLDDLQEQVTTLSHQLAEANQKSLTNSNTADLVQVLEQAIRSFQTFSIQPSEELATGSWSSQTAVETLPDDPSWQKQIVDEQLQLIAQLKQQAKALDQILAASPGLTCVQDRMGRCTYINPAGARMLGYEQSYFLGKTFHDLGLSAEMMELLVKKAEAIFTGGRPLSGEFATVVPSGSKNYEYALNPIHGVNGTIDAVICTAWEITERKKAEIALRESEEKYRNLFELANDSIFIIDVSTGSILNANRNAARRLGYTRRELLQLTLTEIETPEATTSREAKIVPELQRTGNVIFEHILRHKNGSELPVEISCRLIEYGDRLVFQSFARDITERKQLETALEERVKQRTAELSQVNELLQQEIEEHKQTAAARDEGEQQFSNLVETMSDGFLIADHHNIYTYANDRICQMLGYERDEIVGHESFSLICEADHEMLREQIARRINGERSTYEIAFRHKAGHSVHTIFSATPMLSAQGQHQGSFGVVTDITERKQAEEQLRISEEGLRMLIQNLQIGVLILGSQTEILFCNPAALRLLGLTQEQLLGKTFLDPDWQIVSEDGSPLPKEALPVPQAIATRQPVHDVIVGVYRPTHDDWIQLLVNADPQFEIDGSIRQVFCTISDVNDREEA
ncbi:PAS domain S-box protein [Leptolyngbya sp. FACHB-541]|uniref:PAS domain S-box protein n=1 Tax=Leptolyngbya sp. FACHB-541 TaxID=2692810 RepID=UPI001688E983|nr:PAS domain S-box protein [Leptolyngbya sp. FACHB-541]MBD2000355.1 PAS domain S-box protein [Leptolyngbya sp. FACHB-541]